MNLQSSLTRHNTAALQLAKLAVISAGLAFVAAFWLWFVSLPWDEADRPAGYTLQRDAINLAYLKGMGAMAYIAIQVAVAYRLTRRLERPVAIGATVVTVLIAYLVTVNVATPALKELADIAFRAG